MTLSVDAYMLHAVMPVEQDKRSFDSTVHGITVTHEIIEHGSVTELDPVSRFLVPEHDIQNTDESYMSKNDRQQLKWHDNAPKHIKEWSEEFTVTHDPTDTYDTITRDAMTTYGNVVATFHPEPVIGGRARRTDKTWTITAPLELAMVDSTTLAEDDSHDSDVIARFRHAPDIVKNWGSYTGWPFSANSTMYESVQKPLR